MAHWQWQSGTCTGRLFTNTSGEPGFCARLFTWLQEAPLVSGLGGPQWYLYDDQRTLLTDPYAVFCNQSSPTWDSAPIFIKIGYVTAAISQVQASIELYATWNNTTHTGKVINYWGIVCQDTQFFYDFRGGPDGLYILTNVAGSWSYFYIDPFITDDEIVPPVSARSYATSKYITKTGDTESQISEEYRITGWLNSRDSSGNIYVSTVRSGGNIQVLFYSNPARTSEYLIGFTTSSSSLGSRTINVANSSGMAGNIIINALGTVSNSNIVLRMGVIEVTAGTGSLFEIGRTYYLYDWSTTSIRTSYLTILDISGDTIFLSEKTGIWDFSIGSVLTGLDHRFIASGSTFRYTGVGVGYSASTVAVMYPIPGQEVRTPSTTFNTRHNIVAFFSSALTKGNPDRRNRFYVMEPYYAPGDDSNGDATDELFGYSKYMLMSSPEGLAVMQYARVYNGQEYLAFIITGGYAYCVLNTFYYT